MLYLPAILMYLVIFPSMLCIALSTELFIHPPCLTREEQCEDGVEGQEEEEETPVTESDSDEQEGALTVSNQTTPRYFRTWW